MLSDLLQRIGCALRVGLLRFDLDPEVVSMDAKFIFMAASLSASFLIADSANANKAIAYEPIVTCEANYRQAPYDMKCWSEKLGKETTIGDFIEAIKSGKVRF